MSLTNKETGKPPKTKDEIIVELQAKIEALEEEQLSHRSGNLSTGADDGKLQELLLEQEGLKKRAADLECAATLEIILSEYVKTTGSLEESQRVFEQKKTQRTATEASKPKLFKKAEREEALQKCREEEKAARDAVEQCERAVAQAEEKRKNISDEDQVWREKYMNTATNEEKRAIAEAGKTGEYRQSMNERLKLAELELKIRERKKELGITNDA